MKLLRYIVLIVSLFRVVYMDLLAIDLDSSTTIINFSLDNYCRQYQSFDPLSGYWKFENGNLFFYGSDSTCGTVLFECVVGSNCTKDTINSYFSETFVNGSFTPTVSFSTNAVVYSNANCSNVGILQDYVFCSIMVNYFCDFNYVPSLDSILAVVAPTLADCQTKVITGTTSFNPNSCQVYGSCSFISSNSTNGALSSYFGSSVGNNKSDGNQLYSFII